MQTWNIKLELKVSDNWVAEGVNFSDEQFREKLEEHIRSFLDYAYYEIEFKVKTSVTKAPDPVKIRELQGY